MVLSIDTLVNLKELMDDTSEESVPKEEEDEELQEAIRRSLLEQEQSKLTPSYTITSVTYNVQWSKNLLRRR